MTVTTFFHAISAFYSYMQYTRSSQVGFAMSQLGSGVLAAMGCWWFVYESSYATPR